MGAITPIGVTRLGEAVFDREQAEADEAQHQREERACLLNARADEINLARFKNLTDEDMALAMETLSTYPMCIKGIRQAMLQHSDSFALVLETYVIAALLSDSLRQAREEFKTLDAIKTGDCH
ncbi:hypothetical protein ABH944_004827 [Caballeronia udeis]|uniref:Uncharacterized protein n=1 Tax=Caballeronia udeis TaxID=1232866 RepID=A0ABW8MLV9_9BURK